MPSYEIALIVKALQKPELGMALKRTCENIMQRGGIVRSMENLGTRQLPFKMTKQGERYSAANYFIINFDSSQTTLQDLSKELKRDDDVIRQTIIAKAEFVPPCRLTDEECNFGELSNPDHEKRIWRGAILKSLKLKRVDKNKDK